MCKCNKTKRKITHKKKHEKGKTPIYRRKNCNKNGRKKNGPKNHCRATKSHFAAANFFPRLHTQNNCSLLFTPFLNEIYAYIVVNYSYYYCYFL